MNERRFNGQAIESKRNLTTRIAEAIDVSSAGVTRARRLWTTLT